MNLTQDLNKFLANLNLYYRKLQNYHWNVEGEDFFIVHAKLQEYYDEVNTNIDEIAEHILILGGQPLGTLKDYIQTGDIQEAQNQKIKSKEIYENVQKDLSKLLQEVVQIKEKADEQKEYGTSALMDNYIGDYSKKMWMLNQKAR